MDERLVRAVKRQSGMSAKELRDVCDGGASAGFPGFTYYKDTCSFYRRWKSEIWALLEETAEEMGYKTPTELIATFNGNAQVSDETTFENLLAWFALEEVARYLNPDY